MRIDTDPKLDFDDVLIRPKRSEAPSRSAIVLEREHRFLNSGATWKGIPSSLPTWTQWERCRWQERLAPT